MSEETGCNRYMDFLRVVLEINVMIMERTGVLFASRIRCMRLLLRVKICPMNLRIQLFGKLRLNITVDRLWKHLYLNGLICFMMMSSMKQLKIILVLMKQAL